MVEFRTERLRLRPLSRDDGNVLVALAGDWRVARMLCDTPYPFTPDAALRWLKRSRGELRLGVELGDQLIGCVGYYHCAGNCAEVGYWLGPGWWGHGYAREATGRLLDYGFTAEGLSAFRSAHFVDNRASGKVLIRLGFEPVARERSWCPARGKEVEALVYRLDRHRAGYPALNPALAILPRPVRRLIWTTGLAGTH